MVDIRIYRQAVGVKKFYSSPDLSNFTCFQSNGGHLLTSWICLSAQNQMSGFSDATHIYFRESRFHEISTKKLENP